MDGIRGYHGWRWVFILGKWTLFYQYTWRRGTESRSEGLLSCVLSLACYFLIADFPEEAKWLTPEEKAFVKARLEDDVGQSGIDARIDTKTVLKTLTNCKPPNAFVENISS